VDNPTVSVLLEKICQLENGEKALAFSSGIAAISNAVLGLVQYGDRIVCVKHCYPDTYRLLQLICARFGVTTEFVDGSDLAALEKALPGARLLYLETPTSWLFEEQDLSAIAKLAKLNGVTTIVDNSWATPIFQQPLRVGIDLVVHSASKYISGHSDTVAGVMVGQAVLIDKLTSETTPYLGAKLSAQEASLLLRGLRTLPLRLQRHQESALMIAKNLSAQPGVTAVYHPGLNPNSNSCLSGYGGLFSFEVDESINIPCFCDALSLFRLGVSWGGHESLVMPAEISINQAGSPSAAIDFGVPPRLIRLFVGLEDPGELWQDLESALANA
jgi:cystathionine beta-lyase/cystathionine gamma-synthase